MMVSEEEQYFQGRGPLIFREDDEVKEGNVEDYIPLRYQNGQGGINLEKVRRDQLQARRQVVRAMIRRLEKLLRRR